MVYGLNGVIGQFVLLNQSTVSVNICCNADLVGQSFVALCQFSCGVFPLLEF